jgi:hypothetical protein
MNLKFFISGTAKELIYELTLVLKEHGTTTSCTLVGITRWPFKST